MKIQKFCFLAPPRVTRPVEPCNPSPCGSNARCSERNRAAACQCIPEYFGDPYVACRPECIVNSDCPSNKACQRNKCIDPCPGTCGINAQCNVKNHIATCTCLEGYIGDPFVSCRLKPLIGKKQFYLDKRYLTFFYFYCFIYLFISKTIPFPSTKKNLRIILVQLSLLWQKILAHQTRVGPILNLQEPMETDVIVLVYLE